MDESVLFQLSVVKRRNLFISDFFIPLFQLMYKKGKKLIFEHERVSIKLICINFTQIRRNEQMVDLILAQFFSILIDNNVLNRGVITVSFGCGFHYFSVWNILFL